MAKDLMDEGEDAPAVGEFTDEQIREDVANVVRAREKAGKANGDVGQAIKTLEEQRGYNRKAFNLLCQLAKQSHEGVADFLRTLNAGVSALSLGTEEQPDLLDLAEADADNAKKTKGKVANLAKERTSRAKASKRVLDPALN